MTDWFTSDTHFGHGNVIKYSGRPFSSAEEMDAELTHRWNKRVQPRDTVYHLGDFAMGPKIKWPEYRRALNGTIVLIIGNHDAPLSKVQAALLSSDRIYEELLYGTLDGLYVHLAHHPQLPELTDERVFIRPSQCETPEVHYRFCGHVHEAWRIGPKGTINVGVDQWGFEPHTLDEILAGTLFT